MGVRGLDRLRCAARCDAQGRLAVKDGTMAHAAVRDADRSATTR